MLLKSRGGRRRFFRAFEFASAKLKKERGSAKKKERESAKKKERKITKKKERKITKAPSAKGKSANSRFFLPPQLKSGFRAQSRSAGGKQAS
jgi:hypothetical protein